MYPDGSMLMLHGSISPRYTDVGSKRGDRKVDAPNWVMGMYSHPLGERDQLGLRLMMSLDPLTESGYGYPLLFQTGETWHSQPLHDRQHPHDLISELSVAYSHLFTAQTSGYLYLGYPGEPALGPPAFMHRLIDFDLPDAPIGHHWQDATHITWGVATAGINLGNRFKVESSVFNGREPDENRYRPDPLHLDSYSGRISFNPNVNHSFQLSYGFQRNPEGDSINQHRTTASWLYNRPLGEDANLSTTFSWGQNILPTAESHSNSFLVEADYQHGRHTYFSRLENIQKSGQELVLPEEYDSRKFLLGAYTAGFLYDVTHGRGIDTGVGGAITVNTLPSDLKPFYGSQTAPVSFQILLRLRPSRADRSMAHRSTADNTPMVSAIDPTVSSPVLLPTPASPPSSLPPTATPSPLPAPTRAEPHPTAPPVPPPAVPNTPQTVPAPVTVGKVTVTVTPTPPRAHQKASVLVTITDTNGNPLTGANIRASLNMTTMDMGTMKPTIKELSNGQYQSFVTFSMAGPWRMTVLISPKGGQTTDNITRNVDITVTR
jgi:hypothetical protein